MVTWSETEQYNEIGKIAVLPEHIAADFHKNDLGRGFFLVPPVTVRTRRFLQDAWLSWFFLHR